MIFKIKIKAKGGKGGYGSNAFQYVKSYKKKCVGGHGGNGGNVKIFYDKNLHTLNHLKNHNFYAENGKNGIALKNGKCGKDCLIYVPLNTVFLNLNLQPVSIENNILVYGTKGGIGSQNQSKYDDKFVSKVEEPLLNSFILKCHLKFDVSIVYMNEDYDFANQIFIKIQDSNKNISKSNLFVERGHIYNFFQDMSNLSIGMFKYNLIGLDIIDHIFKSDLIVLIDLNEVNLNVCKKIKNLVHTYNKNCIIFNITHNCLKRICKCIKKYLYFSY